MYRPLVRRLKVVSVKNGQVECVILGFEVFRPSHVNDLGYVVADVVVWLRIDVHDS